MPGSHCEIYHDGEPQERGAASPSTGLGSVLAGGPGVPTSGRGWACRALSTDRLRSWRRIREAFGDNLAITGHSLGGGLLLQHGADPNTHNGVTRATPHVSALMGKREKQFHDLDQEVTPDVRRGREAVRDWLRRHHVP